jgi:hypothetical protein
MRDFWTFIGGVAVGILAVTGVFAMEEENAPRSGEESREELNKEIKEDTDDDERLIVRAL